MAKRVPTNFLKTNANRLSNKPANIPIQKQIIDQINHSYVYLYTSSFKNNAHTAHNFMESSSNKDKKLTCSIHQGREKVDYLCLHAQCDKNRLLCAKCLKQPEHRRHQIALINTRVQPFSRLCFNTFDANSKIHAEIMYKKLYNIRQVINTSQQQLNKYFQSVKTTFLAPLQTIAGTYTMEMADFALKSIHNQPHNTKLINEIVQKINLLIRVQQNQYQTDAQRFTKMEQCSVQIIAEMNAKVKLALETMKYQLGQLSLVSNSKHNRHFQPQTKVPSFYANRTVQDLKQLSFAEQPSKGLNKLQELFASDPKKLFQPNKASQKKIQPQKMQEEDLQPKKMRLYAKKQKKQKNKKKNKIHPLERKTNQRQPNLANSQLLQIETSTVKHEKNQLENQESGIVNQNILQRNEIISSQNKQEQEESINSWTLSSRAAVTQMPKSSYKNILKLEIQTLQPQYESFFTVLKELVNLQELTIFDNVICEQNRIIELIQHLPKSIKRIYFNCSNQFNKNCISILQKRRLTEITSLEYFYDVQRLLCRLDQSLYFREKQKGFRIQPLDNQDTFNLLQRLPNLKNLWVNTKNFKISGRKKMKFHNIQSLVIGQMQTENQDNQLDPVNQKLAESLKYTNNLKCLALCSLHIQPSLFISVVKANRNLETLFLETCHGISQQTMKIVTTPLTENQEIKLRRFSIRQCADITGAFVQALPQTQIFIVDFAPQSRQAMNQPKLPSPYTSFQKCDSLVFLNFCGNPYLDDYMISTFRNSFSKLRSINIGYTCITDASVQIFKNLPDLQCLCLDDNKLTPTGILSICTQLPKLVKLSLCGYNGKKEKAEMSCELLNQIGLKLPLLRHLSLRNSSEMSGQIDLSRFPQLKTVELDKSVGESFISILKLAGIKVFED